MAMNYDTPTKTRPTFGYYRQPDGWITASPATNTDELQYRRSGWVPLTEYGMFEMSTPYMVNNPLEPLFMRGGAHELTVDQVVKQGLYLNPPVVPRCGIALGQDHKRHTRACMSGAKRVEFPQMAGRDTDGFTCTFGCGRPPFPTAEARDQHASVMHAPEKSDERTGNSLAEALLKGFGQGGKAPEADPFMMNTVLAKMEAMQAELVELRSQQPAILKVMNAAAKATTSPKRRRSPNRPKTQLAQAGGTGEGTAVTDRA